MSPALAVRRGDDDSQANDRLNRTLRLPITYAMTAEPHDAIRSMIAGLEVDLRLITRGGRTIGVRLGRFVTAGLITFRATLARLRFARFQVAA